MALSNRDYNGFASSVAARLALRAKGLDSTGSRLVAIRPVDHVLTGFLTPADLSAGGRNEGWNRRLARQKRQTSCSRSMRVKTYHAIAPTSRQLSGSSGWLPPTPPGRISRSQFWSSARSMCAGSRPSPNRPLIWCGEFPSTGARFPVKVPPLVRRQPPRHGRASSLGVWSRESAGPLEVQLPVGALYRQGHSRLDLTAKIAESWPQTKVAGLYPGRQPIYVGEPDLISSDAYDASLLRLPPARRPLEWKAVLDARLVALPTELFRPDVASNQARESYRGRRWAQSRLRRSEPIRSGPKSVTLPNALHRFATFRELPASFRYERRMPAIGINSHVNYREQDGQTTLSIDTVPSKVIDRLQPREIEGRPPTFADLASDPAPCLTAVLDEMRRYERGRWEEKIASLTGIEKAEAERSRDRFRDEIQRFERGLALLADSRFAHVRRSFSLMNRAMAAAAEGFDRWRLFQIVFIVSQLPTLAAREYPDLQHEGDGDVDILWFAAGGGKTEAFLGLILWQCFFDRLRGKTLVSLPWFASRFGC